MLVVVVSHIQRTGCQPEKTTLHGGQSRARSLLSREKRTKEKSLAAHSIVKYSKVLVASTMTAEVNRKLKTLLHFYVTAGKIYSSCDLKKYQYTVYSVTPYITRETRNSQWYPSFPGNILFARLFRYRCCQRPRGNNASFGGETVFAHRAPNFLKSNPLRNRSCQSGK